MSRDLHGHRDDIDEEILGTLRSSCIGMALNRIEGDEELYVGGIWALKRPTALEDRKITHILSVVRSFPSDTWGNKFRHMVVAIDDVDDEDLLVHLPRAVGFINQALHPDDTEREARAQQDRIRRGEKARDVSNVVGAAAGGGSAPPREATAAQKKAEEEFHDKAKSLRSAAADESDVPVSLSSHLAEDADAITPAPDVAGLSLDDHSSTPGAVFVHCAMGKSRSVAATAAYLLFKHPSKFGRASHEPVRRSSKAATGSATEGSKTTRVAVQAAVAHIRRTREIAEPNDGFMRQLELWWDMGCPVAEGELEAHPIYQKWSYNREVEESLAVGEAPTRLRFEDEERAKVAAAAEEDAAATQQRSKEFRCKKCRRAIATSAFVLDHQPSENGAKQQQQHRGAADAACQHLFIEPLGWMRNTLETGELEGRLMCPNERCGASLGRFSWKGLRCNCGGWVTPAFSLAKGRVDEALVSSGGGGARRPGAGNDAERAALGIRSPPTIGGPGRL